MITNQELFNWVQTLIVQRYDEMKERSLSDPSIARTVGDSDVSEEEYEEAYGFTKKELVLSVLHMLSGKRVEEYDKFIYGDSVNLPWDTLDGVRHEDITDGMHLFIRSWVVAVSTLWSALKDIGSAYYLRRIDFFNEVGEDGPIVEVFKSSHKDYENNSLSTMIDGVGRVLFESLGISPDMVADDVRSSDSIFWNAMNEGNDVMRSLTVIIERIEAHALLGWFQRPLFMECFAHNPSIVATISIYMSNILDFAGRWRSISEVDPWVNAEKFYDGLKRGDSVLMKAMNRDSIKTRILEVIE